MANRIYKYDIEIVDSQDVQMQSGSILLCVQAQGGRLCLWAKVNDHAKEMRQYTINIYGTGHALPELEGGYIGTAQVDGCVWHVFWA